MSTEPTDALLQAHLDGELTPEEQDRVEAALAEDPTQAQALDDLSALGDMMRQLYGGLAETNVPVEVPGVPSANPATAKTVLEPQGRQNLLGAASGTVQQTGSGVGQQPGSGMGQQVQRPSATGRTTRFPAQIGGYTLEREIARGGMGRVYLAHQVSLDRPVALKVLSAEWAQKEQFVARFLREARLAGTVRHTNLVQIFEVGEFQGEAGRQLWYSMELVEGEDVEALIERDGTVGQQQAAQIAAQVARALAAAGEKGIIHRDIKPANVLLTRDGTVKLADLGLAKGEEDESGTGSITMKKTVIGSPNYMSPEQAVDLRKTDTRSDVYSLGATLLHMITGERPFGFGTAVEILARVLRDTVHLPDVVAGEAFDPSLRAIVARCMEKDAADRFQTPLELAEALDAWVAGARTPVKAARKSARIRRSGRMPRKDGSGPQRRLSSSGRNRALPSGFPPAAIAAAAVVLVTVIGAFLLRGGSEPSDVAQASPSASRVEDEKTDETPRKTGTERAPSKTGARPEGPKIDPVAQKLVAALSSWDAEHSEDAGERFRRAKAFLIAHPTGIPAEQARALLTAARDDLAKGLESARRKAGALEDLGQLARARGVYEAFLRRHGKDLPGGAQAELEAQGIGAAIQAKLEVDVPRVQAHLDAGEHVKAVALLDDMDTYAGLDKNSERQALLARATQLAEAAKPPKAKDPVRAIPNKAEDERALVLASARKQSAHVATLIEQGKLPAASEALAKLKEQMGKLKEPDEALGKRATALEEQLQVAVANAKEPKLLDRNAAVAALFRGKLKREGEDEAMTLTASYDFADEEQAQDWRRPHELTEQGEGARRWLMRLPLPKAPVDAWGVYAKRKSLLAYGHDRRRLVATFRRDSRVEIEVDARSQRGENILIAFGSRHAIVVGLGYVLPELPTATIPGGGEIRAGISRAIQRSRQRGPAAVILREVMPCSYRELWAQPMKKRLKKAKLTAVWAPVDGEKSVEIQLFVGRRQVASHTLEKRGDGPMDVSLLTLGSAVSFNKVTVRGRVSGEFLKRVDKGRREAAKRNKDDPTNVDAFRERFQEIDEQARNKHDNRGKGKKPNEDDEDEKKK